MRGLVRFASEQLGLELYPGQAEVLTQWAASRRRKAVFALGRRSGKGLMAAVVAVYNAVIEEYLDLLRPGEARFIVVVATRQEQAREFLRTVRELLAAAPDPDLVRQVDTERTTLDEVVFRNGVVLRAMPCSSRSTRGLAISLLIMDEAAHMITDTDGFAAAKTVYDALVPSTAQFGKRGYVLLTSSPSWPAGLFHDLYQAGSSGTAGDVFVARRPTWEMNLRIRRDSLAAEFAADPEVAAAEYGAEFRSGGGAFLNPDMVRAAVVPGRRRLPPLLGQRYVAAADPAFAAGGDAFTFAIAHRVGAGDEARYILDRLECWRGKRSPLNSDLVLDEIAQLAKEYHVREVVSDQYAVVPLADGLRRRGIGLKPQPLTAELKADIFGSLKRAANLGLLELLDDPELIAELNRLEIRRLPSGKPRIAGAGGFKDDRAMAVATAIHALKQVDAPGKAMAIAEMNLAIRALQPLVALMSGAGSWRDA